MDWLAAGTRMAIVLDPRKRSASVYRGPHATLLTGDNVLRGEDIVPGWSVALKDLFG